MFLLVDSVRCDGTYSSSHLNPQSVCGSSRRKKDKGGDDYSDSGSDTSYRNAGMVGQAPHSPAVEMQSGGSGGSKAVQNLVRPTLRSRGEVRVGRRQRAIAGGVMQ